MVNNIEQIRRLLIDYSIVDAYYVVFILKRHKDGHEGQGLITSFVIDSLTSFDNKMPVIKTMCDAFGARAYITVAPRTKRDFMKRLLALVTEAIIHGNFTVKSIYDKAILTTKPSYKRWIIDVDDLSQKEDILKALDKIFNIEPGIPFYTRESYLHAIIPTVTGCHLIVNPFKPDLLLKDFPKLDIHTRSQGTLLYYGKES